jgi:hypothetical protein
MCVLGLMENLRKWSEYKDSNLGPPAPKAGALPGCATLRRNRNYTLTCCLSPNPVIFGLMGTFFNGKISKRIRALIALGFLLFSLLGSQYLGFAHSIAHAGFQKTNAELSSVDHPSFSISHGSADCHLFDALTLASFITPDTHLSVGAMLCSAGGTALSEAPYFQTLTSPYQSRAPPSITL